MHIHIYMMHIVCIEILPAFHEQSSDGLRQSLLPPNTSSNDPTTDMCIYVYMYDWSSIVYTNQ